MTLEASASSPSDATGDVYFHRYNIWDNESGVLRAVREVTAAASRCHQLHVLTGEAWFGYQYVNVIFSLSLCNYVSVMSNLKSWFGI